MSRPDGYSKNLWSRRGRFGKATIIVVGCLIALTALGATLAEPERDHASEPAAAQAFAAPEHVETPVAKEASTPEPTSTETPEPTVESTPEPEPTPAQPSPKTVTGIGQQVKTVRLRESGALIVKGTHQGTSNFIVDLVPRGGDEFDSHGLYNEIGNYTGQTVVADAGEGRYRIKVDADGPWKLTFSQPAPPQNARSLTNGTIKGTGAKAIKVSARDDLQLLVKATHRGDSNFIAELVPYGPDAGDAFLGTESLFNEIGSFEGETLIEGLTYGDYLLHVQADGAWTLRFRE